MRVIKEDGSACGAWRAIGRSLKLIVDGLLFGLVAGISMKFSLLNQRLGDKWFGTIVVRGRDFRSGTLLRLFLASIFYAPLALFLVSFVLAMDRIIY